MTATLQQTSDERHATCCEGMLEHRARQAVDLDHQEPLLCDRRPRAATKAPDREIDRVLASKGEIVE